MKAQPLNPTKSDVSTWLKSTMCVQIGDDLREVTVEQARALMHSLQLTFSGSEEFIQPIIDAAGAHFGAHPAEIVGSSRQGCPVNARHAAMFLASELTGLTVTRIGQMFGNRDHTTVVAARKKVATFMDLYPEWKASIETLRAQLAPIVKKVPRK